MDNGKAVFGSYCKVHPAAVTDVVFQLNTHLKEEITSANECRQVTVNELKNIDPFNNNEKFTIRAKIHLGEEDLVKISTTYGVKKIKRDVYTIDTTGKMKIQVFENNCPSLQTVPASK